MSDRLKLWLWPFVLAGIAAIFMAAAGKEIGNGARSGGITVIATLLRTAIGTPTVIALAFGLGLLMSYLAMPPRDRARPESEPRVQTPTPSSTNVGASPPPQSTGFGRRVATPPSPAETSTIPQSSTRVTDPADLALKILSENSFDWYFAHVGDEGRWREAKRLFEVRGRFQLADIMERAGQNYERYLIDVFAPSGGDPPQEDSKPYVAASGELGRQWRTALSNVDPGI